MERGVKRLNEQTERVVKRAISSVNQHGTCNVTDLKILRKVARSIRKHVYLMEERARIEQTILRQAMLDELVTRHAQRSAIMDRARQIFDSASSSASGAEGGHAYGDSAMEINILDRANIVVTNIETALKNLRPGVATTSQPHTTFMLQVHAERIVNEARVEKPTEN